MLACGFKYVGQTSRCVNDIRLEHLKNVKINPSNSEIAIHIGECVTSVRKLVRKDVLHKEPRRDIKGIVKETISVKTRGNFISQASMHLDNK